MGFSEKKIIQRVFGRLEGIIPKASCFHQSKKFPNADIRDCWEFVVVSRPHSGLSNGVASRDLNKPEATNVPLGLL